MGTIASTKSFYYYLNPGNLFTDISKKLFSTNYYHSSSSYYKAVLGQYTSFSTYINIYTNSINLNSMHSSVDIQADVLGATSKELVYKYGKPVFTFTENNLSVLVYKWKFNGIKTRCEIHCYDDKAFLVNYIYNRLMPKDKSYIINTITQKYLGSCINQIDLGISKVTDQNNNILFIDDFLTEFKVTYMSNSEDNWFETMLAEIKKRKDRENSKIKFGEKSFFNRI